MPLTSNTSQPEAFLLFSRWRDERTRLRVAAKIGVISFDLETVLGRVDEPLLGLGLAGCGFIEFMFDNTWKFYFGAPDTLGAPLETLIGGSPATSKHYEFGETIIAKRETGSLMLFMEIVREVA
jgi:hypothetical protein